MPDTPYATCWLKAKAAPLGKNVSEHVKVGTRVVQKRKGMFNSELIDVEEDILEERTNWVANGKFSDTEIDKEHLSNEIQRVSNNYWNDGYELFQIMECTKGDYNFKVDVGGQMGAIWSWGYGYGYSLTDGVIMVFRKRPAP